MALAVTAALTMLPTGCKADKDQKSTAATKQSTITYPARPSVAPTAFKLFHQSDNTITLFTKPDVTDEEIEAILWQLRDAAQSHEFDALHISQKVVDARKPILWFHVYRGPQCASEKYADKLPCGASYHAAGEFTLGSYTDPNWNSGELLHHDHGGDQEIQLWNPDAKGKM